MKKFKKTFRGYKVDEVNSFVCDVIAHVEGMIDEIKENPKDVLQETLEDVKGKINNFIDDNFVEEDNIHISEDEIVISRTFNEEGESK